MALFALLMSVSAFSAPLSLKSTPYFHPESSANIVIFYTTWCPPCKRGLVLLDEMHKEHPRLSISRICVDTSVQQKRAQAFGILQTVPLILIADRSGSVIKRFSVLPDKKNLNDLIQRLEEGRLENGTLPPEKRIDSWKQNRKGM
ncbi:MAG TPA: thioredoxin family protein [Sulfuricurvum sp.]|nr:thioredoxin family protein [Sulfuricurvum sp.]